MNKLSTSMQLDDKRGNHYYLKNISFLRISQMIKQLKLNIHRIKIKILIC